MSFINTLHKVDNMNTLFRGRKQVVILIIFLLPSLFLRVHQKALKDLKNDGYQSHPGGPGHPWDKGRSF